mmetsp:Transcript_28540/g.60836  ORF Transcript_28540/g.60836 Transcript_28540/m.60836 type:complete len:107 (-) Transcript_28540:73-393(-)
MRMGGTDSQRGGSCRIRSWCLRLRCFRTNKNGIFEGRVRDTAGIQQHEPRYIFGGITISLGCSGGLPLQYLQFFTLTFYERRGKVSGKEQKKIILLNVVSDLWITA